MEDRPNGGAGRVDAAGPSVIIPALDEAATIARCLEAVGSAAPLEVIVVDGGSRDGTPELARAHGATVIAAPPGRAAQMNAGASAARGATLLFLHADTIVPSRYDQWIARALASARVVAGAFTLRIDGEGRGLRFIERGVAWRSRVLQLPYGDQALFLRADTFRAAGGFPPLPVLEDYELIRRLRRRGRIVVVPAAVLTSARRWRAGGVRRTTLRNLACLLAYHAGVAPERIARWRSAKDRAEPRLRPAHFEGSGEIRRRRSDRSSRPAGGPSSASRTDRS
jgi:rSAM/selenodomain-associated transferase 2